MKKEDIKNSLSRIVPREELVEATVSLIREKRERRDRASFFYHGSFAYRLASAACALAVVIGVGAAASKSFVWGVSDDDGYPRLQRAAETYSSAERHKREAEPLVATASSFGHAWAVVNGCLDSCYFVPLTEEEAEQGIAAHCIVEISSAEVIDSSVEKDALGIGEELCADIYFSDTATADNFTMHIAQRLNFHIFTDAHVGTTVFEIRRYMPSTAE